MKRSLRVTALLFLALLSACRTGGDERIFAAIQSDNVQEIRRLLAAGVDANERGRDRITPLHLAAFHNSEEVIEILIGAGADVNAKTKTLALTPVMYAVFGNAKQSIELLLPNGADVNVQTNRGTSALHIAAQNGHMEVMRMLLANEADVHVRTNDGRTALMLAAQFGHEQAVQELLVKGVDVNLDANNGATALSVAKTDQIAELLKAAGATH